MLPVTDHFQQDHFIVRRAGKWMATPLLVVLIIIETSDIIFAFDSIPAILAITKDQFILFRSNAFAILGLRALYFTISNVMQMFRYLNYGLAAILIFVGIKMIIAKFYEIPTLYALSFIIFILIVSMAASVLFPVDNESFGRTKVINQE
jgi:tellurite resistance protein TerC